MRDLRLGNFDVLVGVNLLREGLDLPRLQKTHYIYLMFHLNHDGDKETNVFTLVDRKFIRKSEYELISSKTSHSCYETWVIIKMFRKPIKIITHPT